MSHNVYVIELDQAVIGERKFLDANPDCDLSKACLYVGVTGLTPAERFENHKKGRKANKYVKKYGTRLRPEMYEKFNPMSYEAACSMEVALADVLRAKGHAVWQK